MVLIPTWILFMISYFFINTYSVLTFVDINLAEGHHRERTTKWLHLMCIVNSKGLLHEFSSVFDGTLQCSYYKIGQLSYRCTVKNFRRFYGKITGN